MTNRTLLAALRRAGVHFQHATSCGGGNRDHRSWFVEFSGPGLPRGFASIYVADCGGSAEFDGKAHCRRLAVEKAASQLVSDLTLDTANG